MEAYQIHITLYTEFSINIFMSCLNYLPHFLNWKTATMPNSIPINWLIYCHFVNAGLFISFYNVDDIVCLFPSHKNLIYTVFQLSHWLLHYWFLSLIISDLLFLEHCVHLPYDLYILCKEITYTPMCKTVNYMLKISKFMPPFLLFSIW